MLPHCVSRNKSNDHVSGGKATIKPSKKIVTKKKGKSQNINKSEIVIDRKILLEPIVVLQKMRVGDKSKSNNVNCKARTKTSRIMKGKNQKPVVMLHRVDETISNPVRDKPGFPISHQGSAMKPVVLLHNILDEITFTTKKVLQDKRENQLVNLHHCNRQPIVLLVDIFEDLYSHDNMNLENQTLDLRQRGLQDVKLSQIAIKPCTHVINVELITRLLVDAVSLGHAPCRHNRPFDLTNPREECQAIVEALWIYAGLVPPKETRRLFYAQQNKHSQDGKSNGELNLFNGTQQNATKMTGVRKKKDWIYVSTLDSSNLLFNINSTPEKLEQFEKKMLSIMKASLRVDPYNWTLSEVGYIIGFWLAKLYNTRGIPDENLPRELVLAKEHFLELHNWNYDAAFVTK